MQNETGGTSEQPPSIQEGQACFGELRGLGTLTACNKVRTRNQFLESTQEAVGECSGNVIPRMDSKLPL